MFKPLREYALEVKAEDDRHTAKLKELSRNYKPGKELEYSVNVANAILIHTMKVCQILNPFD